MKKIVSLLVSASMLAASTVSVMAQKFTQPDLFSSFDSLLGYKSTSADENLPEGWKILYNNTDTELARAKKVDNEIIGNSNTVKLNGSSAEFGAAMRLPFSEVAKTGKIHAGFDMKTSGDCKVRFGGHYVRSGNYNPDDYVGGGGENWYTNNTYLVVENGICNTYQDTDIDSFENTRLVVPAVSADEWHRFDIYIDIDAHSYSIYFDGEEKGTYDLRMYELKSFWFQCDTGTAYVDNIYMNHYQTDAANDGMKMAVDYDSDGVALSGGKVNVAFSESTEEGIIPKTSYFKAVNLTTGKEYEPEEADFPENTAGIDLTFGDLPAGRYELSVVSENIKGAVSGSTPENTDVFVTKTSSMQSVQNFYMNQEFNGYAGGIPAGWTVNGGNYDLGYGDETNNAFSVMNHEGGNALGISSVTSEKSIDYKFPSTIYDGKFTVEFDVYHGNSASWAVGLLTPAEYTTELVSDGCKTANADKDEAWWTSEDGIAARRADLHTRRFTNTLFATWEKDSDGKYTKLCTGKELTKWYNGVVPNVSVPENAWTHIKAVIDSDACEYRVSVNGGEEQKITGVTRLRRQALYNVITKQTEYNTGIAGIRIHANKNTDGEVAFDNIKVYSNSGKAYNMYEDYNTLNHPYQPYNCMLSSWEYFITGVDGRSGNAGDKAMRIDFASGQNTDRLFYKQLSVPVKAGRSFDVEFDIKNEAVQNNANGTDGWWELLLAGKNETSHSSNWVIGKRSGESIIAGTGANNNLGSNTGIKWKTGEWHHIKLSVIAGSEPKLELAVTYQDGTAAGTWSGTADGKFNTKDTYILGIRNDWKCGSPITIDNLTVSERDAYKADVLSINSVGYDNVKKDLNGTAASDIKGIEINLSQPLSSAEAVKLYYTNAGTASKYISCTKTLSNGGRTVNVMFNQTPRIGEDIVIGIEQGAEFANSYLTNFAAFEKAFKLTEADGKLVVTDFRVYRQYDARTDKQGHTFESAWVPYAGESFADFTDVSKLKIIARGYNTGSDVKLFFAGTGYKTGEDGISEISGNKVTTSEIGKGNFECELTDLPFSEDAQVFKGMLWTYPGMIPLKKTLEYNR